MTSERNDEVLPGHIVLETSLNGTRTAQTFGSHFHDKPEPKPSTQTCWPWDKSRRGGGGILNSWQEEGSYSSMTSHSGAAEMVLMSDPEDFDFRWRKKKQQQKQ